MKFEMTKETEGQRGQEVKERQLVKGWGGRIWNRQRWMHRFHLCTHRNLHRRRSGERKGAKAGSYNRQQKRKARNRKSAVKVRKKEKEKGGWVKHTFPRHMRGLILEKMWLTPCSGAFCHNLNYGIQICFKNIKTVLTGQHFCGWPES